MSIIWMIAAFVAVLTPIIIIHELGHFWVAKWFGIEVEEFGIGLPPRAKVLFERDGTKFTLNWIPLGGFVRPAGEDDPSVPGGLSSASKTARFWTLAAGAIFNFIAAFFVLLFAFSMQTPEFDNSKVAITAVMEDSEAARVGLQENDIFVAVDGIVIGDSIDELQVAIQTSLNKSVELDIERDGEILTLSAIPQPSGSNPDNGALGVGLGGYRTGVMTSMGLADAARESVGTMWNIVSLTVRAPAMLMQGELTAEQARPISPVGISQIAGSLAESAFSDGNWFSMLYFIGLINVGLGFTNLLPLPALDGGRILFVLIELVRGRRITPEREGFVHMVGMLLLLGLMFFMMFKDIVDPIFIP